MKSISIVIPAKNESAGLDSFLPDLRAKFPDAEIIVVDDGSNDNTKDVCSNHSVKFISHNYSKGNGAAIKTGVRNATNSTIVLMDADGQHKPEDISKLLECYESGHDMVVGARSRKSQASIFRLIANSLYNWLASKMVNHPIEDLTSGFRIVNREKFLEFISLLPNGFSYPTTITMAFFRAGYSVGYIPIEANKRIGKSHIKIIRDGFRFILIIFKIATLYSPLKIFVPISFTFFATGFSYYLYTFFSQGRFTNMSALLLTTSIVIFLIGLVSEQITTLIYKQ